MKKDITIPKVTGVSIVAVLEYNDVFKTDDWNVYIINEQEVNLEAVLIVSKGFDKEHQTSILRKKIGVLPANSFAKIELIQPELFKLKNQFQVTFFKENQLFEKTYIFEKNRIDLKNVQLISVLNKKGIIAN